ncbi:hypothetical protein EYY60_18995 [Flavobacterium zhairuonense]|uniref:hypothetical protein n=1 Tax=Flavobacterium zhairuonense TaxID=2493631 RepID=UPI00104E5E5C|nr:hypothetical protein [Flavobacterium zhairuonense]KAF2508031.1 hypothetical protein EYY60_18995 [Flavobacterium zhairuonense]
MFKVKLCLFFLLSISTSALYSQKGFRVDKDYRIKKYQKEIIQFLIDHNQFGVNDIKAKSLIKKYSNNIGISKCIEVFSSKPERSFLLVRFYSFGSGADNYWGILEKNNKHLFYYDEKDISSIAEYTKGYDIKNQKILLDYLKMYNDWSGPNLHSPQVIDETQ